MNGKKENRRGWSTGKKGIEVISRGEGAMKSEGPIKR